MKHCLFLLQRSLSTLLLLSALSACSILQPTPMPPPAPTSKAQEVVRGQTATLTKIGNVSARVSGSPMDVEAAIRHKADAAGAHYYLILYVSDQIVPGRWSAEAILYR